MYYFQEPNNLTNLSSYRYSGLVHKKCVGIEGGKAPDKKGFIVVTKKAKKHVSAIVQYVLWS